MLAPGPNRSTYAGRYSELPTKTTPVRLEHSTIRTTLE